MSTLRQLILELLLIRERYSDGELQRAADILKAGELEEVGPVLALLASVPSGKSTSKGEGPKKVKLSGVVTGLLDSDPERYGPLSKIERKLRSRELLGKSDELAEFLTSLGIKGLPRRREAQISKAMETLVTMPWADAKERIDRISKRTAKSSSAYRDLANFLLDPQSSDDDAPST